MSQRHVHVDVDVDVDVCSVLLCFIRPLLDVACPPRAQAVGKALPRYDGYMSRRQRNRRRRWLLYQQYIPI